MKKNFKHSLELVLNHEGGYVDHSRDPGGATNKGITLATFRRHYGQMMDKDDLKNITDEQVWHIYKIGYWDRCCCDLLPDGIDHAVFDFAVNSGNNRAARTLQLAVDAYPDGIIGEHTMRKIDAMDARKVIDDLCDARLDFLIGLQTFEIFGRGWSKRVKRVREEAKQLCI